MPPSATPSRQHSSLLSPRASAGGAGLDADDVDSWGIEVTDEDRAVWAAQEAMAERLPMVSDMRLVGSFQGCQPRLGLDRVTMYCSCGYMAVGGVAWTARLPLVSSPQHAHAVCTNLLAW